MKDTPGVGGRVGEPRPNGPLPLEARIEGTRDEVAIHVRVRAEQVEVRKESFVTEVVDVRHVSRQTQELVHGAVRREVARVEREGDVPVADPLEPAQTEETQPLHADAPIQRGGRKGRRR